MMPNGIDLSHVSAVIKEHHPKSNDASINNILFRWATWYSKAKLIEMVKRFKASGWSSGEICSILQSPRLRKSKTPERVFELEAELFQLYPHRDIVRQILILCGDAVVPENAIKVMGLIKDPDIDTVISIAVSADLLLEDADEVARRLEKAKRAGLTLEEVRKSFDLGFSANSRKQIERVEKDRAALPAKIQRIREVAAGKIGDLEYKLKQQEAETQKARQILDLAKAD